MVDDELLKSSNKLVENTKNGNKVILLVLSTDFLVLAEKLKENMTDIRKVI